MSYTLSEHESKQLLRGAGIPVPDEQLVASEEAAVAAGRALGLPVALKLCGRKIAHKTERNLVRLGIRDEQELRRQAAELLTHRAEEDPDAGLLVAPMLSGRREIIAGLVRDAQFGPCVMLGLGGIFAEALGDVAFAAAPLAPGDAEDLIDGLQFKKILGAFRGDPAVDRPALVKVIEGLAKIGTERPDVRSIDINPLILVGGRPVVVDALVEIEGDAR
jgi:acetate---CoA ligase (ADP-forming) subunit beta